MWASRLAFAIWMSMVKKILGFEGVMVVDARTYRGLALAAGLLLVATLAAGPAITQTAQPRASGVPAGPRDVCGPKSIGVARTVQIDATGGPRFGHQQYKERDFLADGEVVLTFDDGPSSVYTPRVIEALEAHCTKATFFMVGSRAVAEARIVRDIIRRGHTVGTHTWSHANLRNIGAVRAKDEMELGFSAVQRAAGQPIAPFFRFPYLADSRAIMAHAQTRNIAAFSIDADSYDYKTLSPAEVHRAIITQLTAKRKGIILFHDIQPATAGAIAGLLADLKARGFKVVHMVPGAAASTLPAYDVMAARNSSKSLIAAAAHPLAKRAVTWPSAAAASSPTGAPGAANQPLPWAVPAAGGVLASPPADVQPLPPLPAPAAPPRRQTDDTDWRTRIFQR